MIDGDVAIPMGSTSDYQNRVLARDLAPEVMHEGDETLLDTSLSLLCRSLGYTQKSLRFQGAIPVEGKGGFSVFRASPLGR